DEAMLAEQEALKENIKRGFSILADCYVRKDGPTIMKIILDPTEPARVRLKAAEMIGDIGELDAVDPLRDLKVGNELVDREIVKAVSKIHKRFFTRECPFCAEIIKDRAKVCKHCGKEVAGQ
ncbi:MAG: zinc ribbon domain-containing protein, partial [Desulfobacterales bacterium]|nr:zinc ribbon domain-containing protein [Desulfobacterales bacterium]